VRDLSPTPKSSSVRPNFLNSLHAILAGPLRRPIIFTISIAGPFGVEIALHNRYAALIGSIAGLLPCFADDLNAGWRRRFSMLALAGAGLSLGALTGHALGGYSAAFWLLFLLLCLGSGLATGLSNAWHLALRFAAIALAVASDFPQAPVALLWALLLGLGFACAARLVDIALHARAVQASATAATPPPAASQLWLHFATAYAAAAAVALGAGLALGATRAFWIMMPPLITMQLHRMETVRRAFHFATGTVIGSAAVLAMLPIENQSVLIAVALVLVPLIPHRFPDRFWLQTSFIAAFLMTVYRVVLGNPAVLQSLLRERLEDIALGCAIAVAASWWISD